MRWTNRVNSIALTALTLLATSASAPAYFLNEIAPQGKSFDEVSVTWTHDGQVIQPPTRVFNVTGVLFNTHDEEDMRNLPRGYITDWKQYRKLNDGTESTLEGLFAAEDKSLRILSYEDAYVRLGLAPDDALHLPDFSADLDEDGFPETALFSAINLYDLAASYSQFINNQPFDFGRSYLASEFLAFGFVFSLYDNIEFDASQGFVTETALPPMTAIIADSTHVTWLPEPASALLCALLGLIGLRRAGGGRSAAAR